MSYIVVSKHQGEYEPIHPGAVNDHDAHELERNLNANGFHVEVWSAERWERYDEAIRAELFGDDIPAELLGDEK
jgi:hypothetical protein